ncbi:PTS sugar transporter subunit IIA [Virgibacillus sp. NKC19-3]|uniref:PTS sugar transporter subunit IIA n=1 Tax=Virgibacillus saliphilus TaxID=2831674 RepID=UPI001C9B2264|nr:PTS sugar transporter subunit IIA [Virgibacillus sp. NKC19-3]MBY7144559.1 PTS sugar transporter subunit IIA [Virgibacillus sp. NKC19-3]
MLESLLSSSTISLQVHVENWQEAGQKAGELLLENNIVEERYIQSMIDGVYEYGPYIVIAPGIALFHARPEEGVKEIGLTMITLENPVDFGAGNKDPVDLVFALGAVDHNTHLNLMAELMRVLQDKQLLEMIRTEENVDRVLNMINKKLREEN